MRLVIVGEPSSQARSRVAGGGVASGHLMQLPLARVKLIIKTDPDTSLASQEAVLLITKVMGNFAAGIYIHT